MRISLFIPERNSPKVKRAVSHSLKACLKNYCFIVATQIDGGDKWRKAGLAIAGVERSGENVLSVFLRE